MRRLDRIAGFLLLAAMQPAEIAASPAEAGRGSSNLIADSARMKLVLVASGMR